MTIELFNEQLHRTRWRRSDGVTEDAKFGLQSNDCVLHRVTIIALRTACSITSQCLAFQPRGLAPQLPLIPAV